jgi:subtilisin family serine protease
MMELWMRRRNFITLLLICFLPVLFVVVPSQAAGLAPELQAALSSLRDLDEISVILTLSEKADIRQMKGRDKRLLRSTMIRTLKEKASVTQRPIKDFLELKGARKIRPLWLINGIAVTAPAAVIHELIDFPGVEEIRLDETILAPVVDQEVSAIPEWNLSAIRVPELWAFGYTGQGVVVANMDTGVDVNHPDLQSRWRGGTNSWFDPNGRHSTPFDANGHGTSTMGVMVGGDAGGTAIGVAPGARWIAVKIFNDSGRATLSRIHEGFQWLLDPDDNPDIDDAPDVVNNSWGLDNINGCSLEFEPDIQALKAAGIAVVFAGGNSGPNLFTSISPANNPGAFAVGSVSQSLDIAFTSSRGPSACGDDIYPEVVAPGVSIRTADLFNLYMTGSGTSFAAPHVAGAMALLLSAFPTLTVSELESALQQSAFDLGVPGPDNSYGYGLLDVLAAYQLLFDSAPDIFADPSSYEFTKTKEGSFSLPKTFTVINRGTEDLSIFDIAITGTHFTEFLKQSDECSGQILAPSEVCILEIVFSPTSGGIKRADLLISSNDPDDNSLSITLIGTGKEQYKLDVATTGTGTGRVVSKSKKIDCGLDCSELYSPGRVVTLEAVADPESKFEGWSVCSSSGCGSSVGTTRMVRMSTDKNVTATFIGPSLTLTAPNGGETWRKGTSKRIKWTFTGRPGLYVKIELLQGETAIRTIAKQAPKGSYGKGHFDWFISEKLPDGADYKIRITSTRNSAHTDTSEDFLAITP